MTPMIRPVFLAAATALFAFTSAPGMLRATSLAGSYLAAGQANFDSDYEAAALYYARALTVDPGNLALMQNLVLAYLAEGRVDKSIAVAVEMDKLGTDSQLAQLLLLTRDIKMGDFTAVNAKFKAGAEFSPLLDGLVQSWSLLGAGKMTAATARFDKMAKNDTMKVFSDYHRALALAVVGDFGAAEKVLAGANGRPVRIGRASLVAHIEILSQLERNDEALAMANAALGNSNDPEITAMRDRLKAGKTLKFDVVTSPTDGISAAFYTLASVLSGQDNQRFGLIYGRIAEYLNPTSVSAILLVADLLNGEKQYDLAVKNFDKVPGDSPFFYSAEIGRAKSLTDANKIDDGLNVLRKLSKTQPNVPAVFTTLGDALRRQSKFAEASKAYEAAIKLLPDPGANQWFIYYARGITYEREGLWDKSVADFRFALKLSPDQPMVLNYLGYGMVEKGINLDEAQKMIETAVAKRPNDGYITDSLGWVLYRVKKYKQSVPHMERAVELQPVDPIINDHLGDVYWMVGRKLEAEFQWRRALSFKPEEKEAKRIQQKLDIGLDAVLKKEAAASK
ncbi:MAG: tetratricopeptide repeat protein [Alphaproteobacteria bacterium]|nr:tetratricopeptide repeat protein [Alphaproteobacteria bacterium]